MNDRLDQLCLLPPPASKPWSGPPKESSACVLNRPDGTTITVDVPLFWFDPPWSKLGTDTADVIAVAVGQLGIPVSAMRSDLAGPEEEPSFHGLQGDDDEGEERDDAGDDMADETAILPRIVPYRPERYGFSDRDFDDAKVIDVRLTLNRDNSGRFAFSPEQIQRWESTPASQPLAGGSWVPAASFPPDVHSIEHLSSKLNQLRELAPAAAVFVSIGCYRLSEELPQVLGAHPDGLIVRMDDPVISGLQLAVMTRHVCQAVAASGRADLPIWIVPGEITPDDAAKLVGLGASAIAVDRWCEEIISEIESQDQQSSRYAGRRPNEQLVYDLVDEELASRVERFKGLFSSMEYQPSSQRLATFSTTWGKALGIHIMSLSPSSTT